MAVKTIILKGQGLRKELIAGGAITPGHLVARTTANLVVVNTSNGGDVLPAFAVENEVVGLGIATPYVTSDTTHFEVCPPGTEVYALLAASMTIVIGDKLVSAGDGTLRKLVVTSPGTTAQETPVALAIEAVTTTGAVGRIQIEVL